MNKKLEIKKIKYTAHDVVSINIVLADIEAEIAGLKRYGLFLNYHETPPKNRIYFGICKIISHLSLKEGIDIDTLCRILPSGMTIKTGSICPTLNDLIKKRKIKKNDVPDLNAMIDEAWKPRIEWLKKLKKHILKQINLPE